MGYRVYSGSKCKRFDKSSAQRMCIAVSEDGEDNIIKAAVRNNEAINVKFELCTLNEREAAKRRSAQKKAVAKSTLRRRKNAFIAAFRKIGKAIREYFVFDTVVGKEKIKGSFKYKCASLSERIRKYINEDKNRSAVAFRGSVALVAFALLVVVLNFSVGFDAVVNGQSVGTVSSKSVCEQIINDVNTALAENFGEESKISAQIVTIPRLVPRGSFTPEKDVRDAICMLSDKMHEMYVIYLEDTQLCACASEEEAQQVLIDFRNYYTGGDENVIFETDKPLVIKAESAPITLLRNVDEAVEVLNGSEKKENEYTVAEGDTLWSISRKFDTSVDEILSLNQGLGEDIGIGDVISVKSYVPVVNVTTKQVKEYTQAVKYETEVVQTDSMYRGKSEITREGENGEVAVVANIVKQNGSEISREILSQTTIKEPVTRIKKVGTKEPPSGYGTGSFISPVYGTITSRFGYRRSGFHKGIDIANSYGTPIRAADNGIVITAGWSGLFGKLVKIDHQNGYVTYYAHNSSFAVKVGDVVEKGEVIAYMGSTGNSTGNHCHFEIYKNGVLKNPDNYI